MWYRLRNVMLGSAALLVASSTFAIAHAQEVDTPVYVKNGFVGDASYLTLTQSQKKTFVAGVIDGLLASPNLYKGNTKRERQLGTCLETRSLSAKSLADALSLYIEQHPLERGPSAAATLFKALDSACSLELIPTQD